MATDRPAPADEAPGPADGPVDPPPDEQRTRAQLYADLRAADRVPATDDDPHRTPDGGWSWKGLRLDPPANHVADQQLTARRAAEGRSSDGSYGDHGLTPAVRRVEAQLDHGTLVPDTEKFALKSPDRFKEKLAKMMATEPDRPADDLAAGIHDGIRYTYIFDFEHYSSEVDAARRLLRTDGHELIAFKPNWSGREYKGINSQWRDPSSGQYFEVQFHTSESWEAKQKTHDAYEKIESPRTSPAERARLREYQQRVSAEVPIPPAALDFRPFREQEK
ncbi:MAG: hypothetical protein JO016_20635 [Actinobacteria bacterium]|nr:hypothetical protein [Actinomycetota bacterium]